MASFGRKHHIEPVPNRPELGQCTICKGAEGELPQQCPGRPMTEEEKAEVLAGELNYIKGEWVTKQKGSWVSMNKQSESTKQPITRDELLAWWVWHRTEESPVWAPEQIEEALQEFGNFSPRKMYGVLRAKWPMFRQDFLPPQFTVTSTETEEDEEIETPKCKVTTDDEEEERIESKAAEEAASLPITRDELLVWYVWEHMSLAGAFSPALLAAHVQEFAKADLAIIHNRLRIDYNRYRKAYVTTDKGGEEEEQDTEGEAGNRRYVSLEDITAIWHKWNGESTESLISLIYGHMDEACPLDTPKQVWAVGEPVNADLYAMEEDARAVAIERVMDNRERLNPTDRKILNALVAAQENELALHFFNSHVDPGQRWEIHSCKVEQDINAAPSPENTDEEGEA
jgi:hypothetical protein